MFPRESLPLEAWLFVFEGMLLSFSFVFEGMLLSFPFYLFLKECYYSTYHRLLGVWKTLWFTHSHWFSIKLLRFCLGWKIFSPCNGEHLAC